MGELRKRVGRDSRVFRPIAFRCIFYFFLPQSLDWQGFSVCAPPSKWEVEAPIYSEKWPGKCQFRPSGRVITRPGRVIMRPSSKHFDAPSLDFCNFLLLFLYFSAVLVCYSTVMDFLPVLEDLGDDLGAGAGSFSLDDLDLDDVLFRQTVAWTSSAAGPSGVSDGSSSHPHLSRGDPIPVTYNLETHAWIKHHRSVSFLLSLHVICFSSFS